MDGLDKENRHECKDTTYRAWLCELANEVWALKEKVEGLENGKAATDIINADVTSGERGSILETNGG